MADVTRQELGNEMVVTEHVGERPVDNQVLYLFSHSNIFYWWPVWLIGFAMAAATYEWGVKVPIGRGASDAVYATFLPNNLAGFLFALVLFLVFLFTNLTMRGLVSGVAILALAFIAVVLAWLDLWQPLLQLIPEIVVYMNTGFYLFISAAVFLTWAVSFFVFDRMEYWRIEAGQITHERLIGGAEQSHASTGVVFERLNQDLFRHWLLGFGSSDMNMTFPGTDNKFYIPNVLFAKWKVNKIQDMIKRRPR